MSYNTPVAPSGNPLALSALTVTKLLTRTEGSVGWRCAWPADAGAVGYFREVPVNATPPSATEMTKGYLYAPVQPGGSIVGDSRATCDVYVYSTVAVTALYPEEIR